MEDRYEGSRLLYGDEGYKRISEAKVLVVGAGGIGCELLKNMALVGFRNIELIDLDTIDVSNLNRQFLFRPQHVGMSKAKVAAEAAMMFNPDCKVIAHHGNVKETSKFGAIYMKKFACVLNALDNIDARRHVNRMCLAAGVPLLDSGTTGYNGQVAPIMKGVTECYECKPKPQQKTYPICTIRSTPDKPVHCIVWAKELFKLVFGNPQESMLYEDPSLGDAGNEEDASTYMGYVDVKGREFKSAEQRLDLGFHLLQAIFCAEIDKRIAMDTYRTAKVPPVKTKLADLQTGRDVVASGRGLASLDDSSIWTDAECTTEFLRCYLQLTSTRACEVGTLEFDKDDDTVMRLVTAAANMRCRVFNIPALNLHDAKGIAGNIIPAIATTNAIAAAEQVSMACRLLASGNPDTAMRALRKTWVTPDPRGGRLRMCLMPERSINEPNPSCFVCSRSVIQLTIDTELRTLQDLVSDVLKKSLGFQEPNIGLLGGTEIYEEGEGCDEDLWEHLPKKLTALPGGGIKEGTTVTVLDQCNDLEVEIVVTHLDESVLQAAWEEKHKEPTDTFFVINEDLPEVGDSQRRRTA